MSRLVLHIGFDKTGTTSIQRFMFESRIVMRARGFRYRPPERRQYPFFAENHEVLTSLLLPPEGVPPATVRSFGSLDAARAAARQWSEGARANSLGPEDTLVVSSEAFYHMPASAVQALSGLAGWSANARGLEHGARVVAYVAEPVSRFRRAASQCVVTARNFWRPRDQAARAYIENYANVFSRERLTVRAYDRARLLNGDVVDDFLEFLSPGLSADPALATRGVEDNRSPSAEALLLCHVGRALDLPTARQWHKFVSEVLLFDRAVEGGRTAALTADVTEHLWASSPDYMWLEAEFGCAFGGPPARRPVRSFAEGRTLSISDIFKVDRGRYRELVSRAVRWTSVLPKSPALETALLNEELIRSSCTVD